MQLNVIILLSCILQSIAGAKIPNYEIQQRIAGGKNAAEGQAPYQCSLQNIPSEHYCGCAIISAEWIITAAHCLEDKTPKEVQIVVGTNQWKSGVKYYPEEFVVHEHYNNPRNAYDIALVRVKKSIEFGEKVKPIKYSAKVVPVGANLQLTGWGLPQINGKIPDNLQVLNVTSITNEECTKKTSIATHDSTLCTLSPRGKGLCGNDSGGPLVFDNELVGIVNWTASIICARGKPDGYARISYLYEWIQKNTNSQ